jgi:hypothetical protein
MPFDGTSKPSIGSGASPATIVLNMMEFFFDGGARWARRTYCTDDGKRCLLGALEYVRCEAGHRDDRAVQYLARAINLRQLAKRLPPLGDTNMVTIIGFNDSFGRSFADIAAVLNDAKQLSVIECRRDKDLDI